MNSELIKQSFNIPYALLMTTGAITFIEAITTHDPAIRHIMNIETCISIIAAFFYSKFIGIINNNIIDYKNINLIRYTDWSITTPLMILSLILFLSYNLNGNKSVNFKHFLLLVIFNYLMLLFGYLGEIDKINKNISIGIGFIFFILLFAFIYIFYIKGNKNIANYIIYGLFVFIWAFYGVAAKLDDKVKNIAYNILDTLAKCIIGIGMWAYFTNIFNH
jgi:bacteriorhodopsin